MAQQILIDFDSVASAIRRIVEERATVPDPGSIAEVEGTSVGVTSPFHSELARSAQLLAAIVETMRAELTVTANAIRKAVEDAAATDAAHADEARSILTALDSIVDQPAATTPEPSGTKNVRKAGW